MKATLLSLALLAPAQGLQMMLKSQDWYCMQVPADTTTELSVDYLVTGINPEAVEFEARQGVGILTQKGGERSSSFLVMSR